MNFYFGGGDVNVNEAGGGEAVEVDSKLLGAQGAEGGDVVVVAGDAGGGAISRGFPTVGYGGYMAGGAPIVAGGGGAFAGGGGAFSTGIVSGMPIATTGTYYGGAYASGIGPGASYGPVLSGGVRSAVKVEGGERRFQWFSLWPIFAIFGTLIVGGVVVAVLVGQGSIRFAQVATEVVTRPGHTQHEFSIEGGSWHSVADAGAAARESSLHADKLFKEVQEALGKKSQIDTQYDSITSQIKHYQNLVSSTGSASEEAGARYEELKRKEASLKLELQRLHQLKAAAGRDEGVVQDTSAKHKEAALKLAELQKRRASLSAQREHFLSRIELLRHQANQAAAQAEAEAASLRKHAQARVVDRIQHIPGSTEVVSRNGAAFSEISDVSTSRSSVIDDASRSSAIFGKRHRFVGPDGHQISEAEAKALVGGHLAAKVLAARDKQREEERKAEVADAVDGIADISAGHLEFDPTAGAAAGGEAAGSTVVEGDAASSGFTISSED